MLLDVFTREDDGAAETITSNHEEFGDNFWVKEFVKLLDVGDFDSVDGLDGISFVVCCVGVDGVI